MDFSVRQTGEYTAESRGWLRGPHGTGPGSNPSVTLDFSLFEGLYPDGFIPSGTVLAETSTEGVYGPYDPAADDDVAAGLLFSSENVFSPSGRGVNAIVRHGNVDETRLPFEDGKGSLDDAAKADLPLIDWK